MEKGTSYFYLFTSEVVKQVRERQVPYDSAYMWNLKKQNRTEMDSDTENKLVVARWEGIWGMGEKGERDSNVQTANY